MKQSTILRCMFICMSIVLAVLAFELNAKRVLNETVIKTNATPITNKVIILDARPPACQMKEQLGLREQLNKR